MFKNVTNSSHVVEGKKSDEMSEPKSQRVLKREILKIGTSTISADLRLDHLTRIFDYRVDEKLSKELRVQTPFKCKNYGES